MRLERGKNRANGGGRFEFKEMLIEKRLIGSVERLIEK